MMSEAQRTVRQLENRVDTDSRVITDRALVRMLAAILRPYLAQLSVVFAMLLGVTACTLAMPYLVQRTVDGPIKNGDLAGLIPYGVAFLLCILGIGIFKFAHTYLLQTVGQNALVALRQQLFEHIIRQDMRFFNMTPVGQIVSRMSNDIEALTELLSTSIVVLVSNLITLVGIVVVMFVINPSLALLSIAMLLPMTMATIYFRRKIRDSSNQLHRVVAEFLAYINEQFGGMLIVQLFGRQAISREEFKALNTRHFAIHNELRNGYTVYASVLQLLTSLGLALVLWGGSQGVLAGWATLGMLIAFVDYTRRMFVPLLELSEQFAQIQTALSAGERIARMLSIESQIVFPEHAAPMRHFQRGFSFENVTFSYEEGHPVLQNVSFSVRHGERIAVVGATGAGKTSLVGLLARFYDVDSGRVLVDDRDVRTLSSDDLRRCVTVVPQSPYCFDGTIADNLRLFDSTISEARMRDAAEIACAAPFIERLPNGYDYVLMPGGANLSQGQRQLIALARALIHNPESILVLDEATSNIDTATEALIQQGLTRILAQRTSLVIAHRLSTIRDADRILVMKRGRIIEEGTHDSLLLQNGAYTRLYQRQFAIAVSIA
jgi:ATP-binding cassette, subfamily B, multidrug efflux pump